MSISDLEVHRHLHHHAPPQYLTWGQRKLLLFFLKCVIMVAVISLFLFFLGFAAMSSGIAPQLFREYLIAQFVWIIFKMGMSVGIFQFVSTFFTRNVWIGGLGKNTLAPFVVPGLIWILMGYRVRESAVFIDGRGFGLLILRGRLLIEVAKGNWRNWLDAVVIQWINFWDVA